MSPLSDCDPYLSKLLTDLDEAVKATDFLRYQRLLANCRHYYSANVLPWAYPMPDKALSFAITQIQPVGSNKETDQIKIIKSLIEEGALKSGVDNTRFYSPDDLFRLACVYGSPVIVKVLLAAGCQVTAELLTEVINGCTRDPYHPNRNEVTMSDQVVVLLLQYYPAELNIFSYYDGFLEHDLIPPDTKLGLELFFLDKPELNRAMFKTGISLGHDSIKLRLGQGLLESLESTRPYHAVELFAKLGWLDVDTVESYSRDREEPLEYLTRARLEKMD